MADQTTKKHHFLKFLKFLLIFIFSVLLLSVIFFLCSGKILSFPASTPRKSDLIVVLGGDSGFRAQKALKLYEAGIAPNVFFINLSKPPEIFNESGIAAENVICGVTANNTLEEGINILRDVDS